MSHHSQRPSSTIQDVLRRDAKAHSFGSTGEFPEGVLDDTDEGEIRLGIAADHDRQLVHFNFGKPVAWFSMTKQQAIDIAASLVTKASHLD